ncbi:MAG: T9SS type A sorting domain-containing protein [Bacteroidia bacterium]
MKKLILVLLMFNGSFQIASAQAPAKLWDSFFNGTLTGKDESNYVLTDAIGNVFVTGTSFQTFSGGNFTTIKYDASGVQLWADHYTNTQASYKNYGKRLVIDKWQNVYAVGTTALHDGDLAVCKYNSTGKIWSKNYEPYQFSTYDDYGIDMDVDSLGNFYAIARVNSPTGNLFDMYLIKCDSSGTKTWDINYTGGSADDYPTAIAVSPGGSAYPVLQSFNFFGSGTNDITTLQFLSGGIQNWFSKYNGPGSADDYPMAIKIDAAENQYVCGTTDAGLNNDMVAMKQNTYGTRLWVTTYNGTANGNDTAISTTWLPNGFVVVTGKCKELLNGIPLDAIVTMVIDSGTVLWTQKFYGSDSLGASPSQMTTDAQGNIYICGYENLIGGTKNGCIIKYNSNGNLLWNISYDAGLNLNDKFNSITLDNNNDIIVTGQTFTTATNANYVTAKYGNSATGITENSYIENINMYPNPANTSATILLNLLKAENISISIVDMLGREIKNTASNNLQSGNNKINLDISDLNNGIYFVRINGSKVLVRRLIVEK